MNIIEAIKSGKRFKRAVWELYDDDEKSMENQVGGKRARLALTQVDEILGGEK